MQHSQSPAPIQDDQEISLIDILLFLKGGWKAIAIFGLAGIVLSVAYLAITPKLYEASAQVIMAQIGGVNNNNNINSLGINVEEPALLIARLSSPTSFTPQVIGACSLSDQVNAGLVLSKLIKLSPAKGVTNVVDIKTIGQTPESSKECMQAIFDLIKTTQSEIIAPYIEEAKVKLADDEVRLAKAKDLVSKADKSDLAMGINYLSTRDEIRYLLGEIGALKNVVSSNQNRLTRLVSPIYVSDIPIYPNKRIVLAVGLFGGLLLGILIVLCRVMVVDIKIEAGGGDVASRVHD